MESKKALAIAALCLFTTGAVFAKLPPPNDEQKAKAEEVKAKAAEVAKKEAEQLGKAQDRVSSRYIQEQKAKGVTVKPTPAATPPAASAAVKSVAPAAPELAAAPPAARAPAKK